MIVNEKGLIKAMESRAYVAVERVVPEKAEQLVHLGKIAWVV